MAAAEARAVWQRTANRCFVQEDAKRAPKLACCQSSSQSKQVDGGPTSAANVPDHQAVGFMPLNRNPSYSNLPPDTRWWLQLQPSYGFQKGLTYEQALEAEVENLRPAIVISHSKISEDHSQDDRGGTFTDSKKNSESSLDVHCRTSTDCMKKEPEIQRQEVKALHNTGAQEFIKLEDKSKKSKLVEMGPIGCLKPQKSNEYGFDPEPPWMGGEKNVPWWRTTDKDDLAFLVAQKSLDYVENCDLPPPQKINVRRYPCAHPGISDHDDTCLDWKAQTGCVSRLIHTQGGPNSKSMNGRQRTSIEGHSQGGSDEPFSYTATHKDGTEIEQVFESDPCKAQLLEALCHSQTRAREAEKIAKQACAEKEHIIKLFFRQASQLFAYKQWFQLLQLETLYYQMKNGGQPVSTLFPVVLPWMPHKGRKLRKNWQKSTKGKRGKQGRPRPDISKYAVAFALGLSLVGAGLLLGWTVGCMLPF